MSLKANKLRDETWVQKDGTPILVGNMSEEHCKNALRLVIRRLREREERRILNDFNRKIKLYARYSHFDFING